MANRNQKTTNNPGAQRYVRRLKAGERLIVTAAGNKTTVRIAASSEVSIQIDRPS